MSSADQGPDQLTATVHATVRGHYGDADLWARVLDGLHRAGVDPDHATVADLAGADQLHAGSLSATRALLDLLELEPMHRLLDVGCGLGGPARTAAQDHGCAVTGIDLSVDFVRVATQLTRQLGLEGLVDHQVARGDRIDAADAVFDRAMMVHVGMNLPDKQAVFAEVRRVLRPGGLFGLYEQVATGAGGLPYPLPWADDATSSFVATVEDYTRDLQEAGFVLRQVEPHPAFQQAPASATGLSPAAVFGPRFIDRLANNATAVRTGLLTPMIIIAATA